MILFSVRYYFTLLLLLSMNPILCEKEMVQLVLRGKVLVKLQMEDRRQKASTAYQYLPFGLKLSEQNGSPEILIQPYMSEKGAMAGVIIHMLLCWGPTPIQEGQIIELLAQKGDMDPHISGPVALSPEGLSGFEITSELFMRCLSRPAGRMGMPGTKTALAFHFKGQDAKELQNLLNRPEQLRKIIFRWRGQYKARPCPGKGGSPFWKDCVLEENLAVLLKGVY